MLKVLVLDPGESTGWILGTGPRIIAGGTVPKQHLEVYRLLEVTKPEEIAFETFQLYPGKAQSMSWNTFYTVEVIGIIKLWAALHEVPIVGYAPSVKKFAGGFLDDWDLFLQRGNPEEFPRISNPVTEHTRDAYKLWKYYNRMRKSR